jgi:amidohydrolase
MSNDHLAQIDARVDALATDLCTLARAIHAEPELCFAEHRAVAHITAVLERHGAQVEGHVGGLPTAFRARSGAGGPRVAILAEYDALPEIGHACGHNLIAAGAVGAFLGIAPLAAQLGGTVELIGTPAEEGGGGKVKLIEAGAFAGLDAAMMYHPFDRDLLMHPTLANARMVATFKGSPSHAAAAPHQGQSALTACMDSFRLVDGQRIHLPEGGSVHGYITNGGQAVNIIVEHAACQFSVRGRTSKDLERVVAIVTRCIRAAAMASDVEVAIELVPGYRDLVTNQPLAERFGRHLESLGRQPRMRDPEVGTGSTDMGDVSHVVPSIHAWLAICEKGRTMCHEHAFAACAASDEGMQTMLVAAKSMARTAADLLADRGLLEQVRGAFGPLTSP